MSFRRLCLPYLFAHVEIEWVSEWVNMLLLWLRSLWRALPSRLDNFQVNANLFSQLSFLVYFLFIFWSPSSSSSLLYDEREESLIGDKGFFFFFFFPPLYYDPITTPSLSDADELKFEDTTHTRNTNSFTKARRDTIKQQPKLHSWYLFFL